MSDLNAQLQRLKSFKNGEPIARRMLQLWDFALDPDNEHLVLSVESVLNAIVAHEEKLLGRSQLDIVKEGSALKQFARAMRESTDEEWADIKRKLEVVPIRATDTERLIADASGLVRDTGFNEWVLGEEKIEPKSIEGLVSRTAVIHNNKEN